MVKFIKRFPFTSMCVSLLFMLVAGYAVQEIEIQSRLVFNTLVLSMVLIPTTVSFIFIQQNISKENNE